MITRRSILAAGAAGLAAGGLPAPAVAQGAARNVLRFNRPGTYHGLCGEFCGRGHQNMYITFIVEDTAAPQPNA